MIHRYYEYKGREILNTAKFVAYRCIQVGNLFHQTDHLARVKLNLIWGPNVPSPKIDTTALRSAFILNAPPGAKTKMLTLFAQAFNGVCSIPADVRSQCQILLLYSGKRARGLHSNCHAMPPYSVLYKYSLMV